MAITKAAQPTPQVADFEDSDDDVDGLQPRIVEHKARAGKTYNSIADVPGGAIRAAALVVLVQAGATDWEDLLRLVARELGFQRLGRTIRERLVGVLEADLRSGALRRVGDRIGIGESQPAESGRR